MKGILIPFLLITALAFGQRPNPVPPTQTREADVLYSKRIWRIIDLREKQNRPVIWPRNPVTKIMYNAILAGQLKPYQSDSLRSYYDLEAFVQRGSRKTLVRKLVDPNDNEGLYTTDTLFEPFDPETQIRHLLLLEEWYFDKRMGKEFPRIIAIAPLFNMKVEGIEIGLQPLCWLKHFDRLAKEPVLRDVLVKQTIFNPNNSKSTFTFDDWFEQRRFSSYIVKESNMEDQYIMDDPEVNRNGLKALIEAARKMQETFEREADYFEE